MPDQDTFKITGTLTEAEIVELSEAIRPRSGQFGNFQIWRKLIAPAEVRYKRTFDSVEGDSTTTNWDLAIDPEKEKPVEDR